MDQQTPWHERLILHGITFAVVANGLIILSSTLFGQIRLHDFRTLNDVIVTLPLVSGLTLVYLGTLLHRRKQAAWIVTVPLYTFILGFNATRFDDYTGPYRLGFLLRNILLPLLVVVALVIFRRVFTVKSAIQNFSVSLRAIAIMLAVIIAYGTTGFLLLDKHDFHQEITPVEAVHRTIDQFDFTTNQQLTSYTKRAAVFVDSLNILSAVAVGYIIIALFQPIRAKLTSQSHNRELALALLKHHSRDSEDFFKLWPLDKNYFGFGADGTHQAMLAYRVQRGVSLVVGDPVGTAAAARQTVGDFVQLCQLNDWLPAFVHVSEAWLPVYQHHNLQVQKLGEEAVVNNHQFLDTTAQDKYFRQIQNKFSKHGYTSEVLQPPHSAAVISRLQDISNDWLTLPGRQERGFMMGYLSEAYMQQCPVLVARDAAGTIQAFLNQIPTYQNHEANFDLLRHTKQALGNVNDYLLMGFIKTAHQQGYQMTNLGLCPLAGLDKQTDEKSVIDSTMRFLYTNGDRFYSFSGLYRFKNKYQPVWRSRYVAYKGGVRNFTRLMYALNQAMNRTK